MSSSTGKTEVGKMKRLSRLQIAVYDIGAVVMLLALAAYGTDLREYVPYAFGAGAACLLSMQICMRYDGRNITIRRLRKQQIFGTTVLVFTAVPMWMSINHVWPFGHNEWMISLAAGAWMELYTAFRMPAELKKESDESDRK